MSYLKKMISAFAFINLFASFALALSPIEIKKIQDDFSKFLVVRGNTITFDNITVNTRSAVAGTKTCRDTKNRLNVASYFDKKSKSVGTSCDDKSNDIDWAYDICIKDKTMDSQIVERATITYDNCLKYLSTHSTREQVCKLYVVNFMHRSIPSIDKLYNELVRKKPAKINQ